MTTEFVMWGIGTVCHLLTHSQSKSRMVAAAAKSAGGKGKNAVQFKDKEKPTDIRESNIEAAKGM